MTITDSIRKAIDIVSDFVNKGDDIYEQMTREGEEYPVVDNMALDYDYMQKTETKPKNEKVTSINQYRGYEVMVCEPSSYEDAMSIVKHLKERKTIILKLDMLDKETALKIVDFLCGATYALSGSQQKIGNSVFIFTPVNVSLSSESQKSKFLKDALWSSQQQV